MADSEMHQTAFEAVTGILRERGTPGASIAISIDGEIIVAAGVGSRDPAGDIALTSDDRFYIYSVTKTLLAAITLQLVERGDIGLDEHVQSYLPEYLLETPVTIRQVLNHTAGLPDYGGMPEYAAAVRANPERAWSSDAFLDRTLPNGLLFAPGEGWAYSNIGYLTIRRVVERVTGLTMLDAVATFIVEPLRLTATSVAESLNDTARLTPGYSSWLNPDGPFVDVSRRYHPGWVSHGVAISTATDVARIIDAVFDGRLVSPTLLPQMLEPVRVPMDHPLFVEPSYGLGLMVDPGSRYGAIAGHGGGGPGYSAGALHFPNVAGQRVTTVALANSDRGDLGLQVASALVDVVAGLTRRG